MNGELEQTIEPGALLNTVFLVTDAQLATDKRGCNYYKLKVNLEGGKELEAKIWGDNLGSKLETGYAIEAMARVEEYRGQTQLNIQRYNVLPPDSFDPSPYIKTTDIDVDEAFDNIFGNAAMQFKNPLLKAVMDNFANNDSFADAFKKAPAASRQHHNYRGGLVEHTLDVCNIAAGVADNYSDKIDREMLLAGAALHDIGKIRCYDLVSGVSEHTEISMLVDHIFIGTSMLSNLWESEIDPEALGVSRASSIRQKSLLLHMLLSHHGKKEWGAPVLPKTGEAVLLHFCDQISATMKSCFDAIGEVENEGEWSDWVTIMDSGRKLFRVPSEL